MQRQLFEDAPLSGDIVNVASVPQRSPFRYPGGKTWLVPRLRRWLESLPQTPRHFVEPFAGGGIASLTVALEKRAARVTMVERDAQVAAVWRVILDQPDGTQWLARRILDFELTPTNARQVLDAPAPSLREQAFATILKNRVNHGGILAPGAGILKHGENGKGITSRWYPATLARRILEIARHRCDIEFIEGDGMEVMEANAPAGDAVYFIDPPYTAPGRGKRAGARLYAHNQLDHQRLFEIALTLKGDFLMCYDNAPGVLELAAKFGFAARAIAMKNTHHAQMSELLVGRDLEWLD